MRCSILPAKRQSASIEFRHRSQALLFAGMALVLGLCGTEARAQNTVSSPARQTLLIPEANRPPDANDQMRMKESKQKKDNFDAANTLRQKQIDDETVKLLILARDLKAQMDLLGDKPLPEKLMREAEVIELLAHDVQARMTLVVKGG